MCVFICPLTCICIVTWNLLGEGGGFNLEKIKNLNTPHLSKCLCIVWSFKDVFMNLKGCGLPSFALPLVPRGGNTTSCEVGVGRCV